MKRNRKFSRREFLAQSALAGLAIGTGASCTRKQDDQHQTGSETGHPGSQQDKKAEPHSQADGKWAPFPEVEARGTPLEIGTAVGSMTRERIIKGIEQRRAWFDDLKRFALADRAKRLDGFTAAIEKYHPDVMAEIKGMASGAKLPLDDILVLNLQVELGALKSSEKACETCDDCSSLHLVDGDRIMLAHNEDGNNAYRTLMSILRLKPEGLPAITALAYPGVVPGCVPAMNDAGLVMTTNYIGVDEVHIGVPRYVLGRAALTATSIGQAVNIVTNKDGAFSFHANFGSTKEKRLVSVDLAPRIYAVRKTEGIFLQTNHFVMTGTKDIPQPNYKPGSSSDSRYQVLEAAMKKLPPIEQVTKDHLITMLSSHEAVSKPYSPCRHPNEKSNGRTLATALFDISAGAFTLYEGNPCEGRSREILS
ncbi:MAG: twin-arginine translocation signal domain-containing protein [Proteobacteria bacterium]|nr:twin-arginine translocation signal domain-containing protein [Pseudomonadota bacterium]